jgi:hypothetical protein
MVFLMSGREAVLSCFCDDRLVRQCFGRANNGLAERIGDGDDDQVDFLSKSSQI